MHDEVTPSSFGRPVAVSAYSHSYPRPSWPSPPSGGRHRGQLRDVGPGRLVGLFVVGGLLVASRKRMLGTIFACLVIIVGVYVVSRGLVGLTAWVRNQHTEEHPCPSPCRRCAGTLW